jgi:hypothetical protein
MSEKTLAQKLALASLDLRGWQPDKRNQEAKYDYISADAVLHRAGEALGKQGLVVLPSMVNHGFDIGTTASGKPRFDAWVHFEFVITDGISNLNASWFGRGTDYGAVDKAVYKAVTSGHKYFLMKLLNIGVGNEDSEHETPASYDPAAAKKAFVAEITATVPRYRNNPARAGNAIKAVLNGRDFDSVSPQQLAKEVFEYAETKDKEPQPEAQ